MSVSSNFVFKIVGDIFNFFLLKVPPYNILFSFLYLLRISRVDENVLVYQPSLNILSSLIKYEKQKKKIEDFNVQSIWENNNLNYKDFKKLHSFYWLFSIDLKSSSDNSSREQFFFSARRIILPVIL